MRHSASRRSRFATSGSPNRVPLFAERKAGLGRAGRAKLSSTRNKRKYFEVAEKLRRKEIYELNRQKQIVANSIGEAMAEFDLKDSCSEYGVEYHIPFEEYPFELKNFLLDAYKELDRIDKEISAVKRKYNDAIYELIESYSANHGFTDVDWEDLHNS